jgi:hypothetical protein
LVAVACFLSGRAKDLSAARALVYEKQVAKRNVEIVCGKCIYMLNLYISTNFINVKGNSTDIGNRCAGVEICVVGKKLCSLELPLYL